MSDGGFTGINIGETRGQLDTLSGVLTDAYNKFVDAFEAFNTTLFDNWFAEVAYDFNKYLQKLAEIKVYFAECVNKLIEDVIAAASSIASHLGSSFSYTFSHLFGDGSYKPLDLYRGNGLRAMNMDVVSNAKDALKDIISVIKGILNNAPKSISLYDKEGNLKARFQSRVTDLENKITEVMESVDTQVEAGINEAKSHLSTGKQSAEEQLQQ